MTPPFPRAASAVVLVYDVTSTSSLVALDSWLEELRHHGVADTVPKVLVGNKADQVGGRGRSRVHPV